jgi:DNA repair exonuclease SbcCD ATPase subunit
MPTEREWAEAFRRLDRGESSYESEAKRLGVGKGTVYRHHMEELQRMVNGERSELSRVSEELSKAKQRLAMLEAEYKQKRQALEQNLQIRVKELSSKLQALEEEKKRVEGEISRSREKLSVNLQELNRTITTQERLKKLGVDKVASLTEFVEGYEALGFSAQQVQKLVVWRQSLAKMGIDPDKLFELAKKRRSLEGQISGLEKERRRVEGIVKKLKVEHRRLFDETVSLQADVLKLGKLGKVVKLGMMVIPCKVCGMEGIFVKLHTASEYRGMMRSGAVLQYRCIYCGQWATYTPWEILTAIGLLATPELKAIRTPTVKD